MLSDTPLGRRYAYNPLNTYTGLEGTTPIREGNTYIGVEVELENITLKNKHTGGTWKTTPDGSLRNNGLEFVTIPIKFKYLEVELKRLFGSIKHSDISKRCSIHIHLNVRDFTVAELKTFMLLYLMFEKSLYKFSGNREDNIFCVPLLYCPTLVADAFTIMDTKVEVCTHWYKYFGLNISPIFGGESTKLGTVEFRHMHGTTDIDYILSWISLIVSLKISAKKFEYDYLVGCLDTLNTNSKYRVLSRMIFTRWSDLIENQSNFIEDMSKCVSATKAIIKPIPSSRCKDRFIIPLK